MKQFIYLFCLILLISQGYCCIPGDRPLDGSCIVSGDRGKAGDIFIRFEAAEYIDNYRTPIPNKPPARLVSNVLLSKDPIPGISAFESALIPFNDLIEGEHPDDEKLNQFSVAFGQALVHELTKVRTPLDFSLIQHPDFALPLDDPLCQIIVVLTQVDILYFPCSATIIQNNNNTRTVVLATNQRYTIVTNTTWHYATGPFSINAINTNVVQRKAIFPIGASLVPGVGNASVVPVNDVTSFIDLSIIYGNSATLNSFLRANDGTGKLLTAPDGDIPFGSPNIPNDCGAFDSLAPVPQSGSGDSRIDENVYLQFVHSLYFRNHNRDAEWVAANRPDLTTDEQRFQRARAINIARFQRQIYEEYLEATFGRWAKRRIVGEYQGYNASIDPRIDVAFDIAFRIAHSQITLPPTVFDNNCVPVPIEGTLGFPSHLRPNCIFTTFRNAGGMAVGKSAISQSAQRINGKVSDLMRNIVFKSANGQSTAAFNLDIEMLNIDRSRRFGVPNYDALRKSRRDKSVYDLPGCYLAIEPNLDPIRCFKYINENNTIASDLRNVYRHVNKIDAFIGLMLENYNDNDQFNFGQTATIIILEQMKRTSEADPFFYLNNNNPYLNFSHKEWKRIRETVAESIELSFGFPVPANAFKVPKHGNRYCNFH